MALARVDELVARIEVSRIALIDEVSGLTEMQTKFNPSENEWSILEITEHIVWAEQIGICGMFNAINGIKNNKPIWEGVSPNKGLSIEQIVEKTWQPKEKVPKVAEPRWGGSIEFWIYSLYNCSNLLRGLLFHSSSVNLNLAIYPHPISGPMDVIQRLEFLSFHLERHKNQVKRVKANSGYPK